MEVLRFDSRRPNPKYSHMVSALASSLLSARLYGQGSARAVLQPAQCGFEMPRVAEPMVALAPVA